MKQENVQILSGKIGRVVKIDYFDRLDSRNHSIEDDQVVHPDLKKALMAFRNDIAEVYYSVSHSLSDYIVPNEFSVTEKDGIFFLTVKGKFSTSHGDEVSLSSGKIPLEDDPIDELVVRLNTLRHELFEYFWNDKNAQQKLPFDEKKEEIQEENTILENS